MVWVGPIRINNKIIKKVKKQTKLSKVEKKYGCIVPYHYRSSAGITCCVCIGKVCWLTYHTYIVLTTPFLVYIIII